jgi:hypothetical protein
MLLPPRTPPGTYWVPVAGGRVLAGPHPVIAKEGFDDRVKMLVDQVKVRHFVDLSSHHDWMPSYQPMLPETCTYTRYEILDRRLPEDAPALKKLMRWAIAEAGEGRVSYFHCQAGLGRTGTVIGVLLRELGYAGQDALDEIVRLRGVAGLHEGSPEFEEQREFIRRWAA